MSEAVMQHTISDQTIAPLDFIISYATNGDAATWSCNGVSSGVCIGLPGQAVNFSFQCTDPAGAPMAQAVLMVGPLQKGGHPSPFTRVGPIVLDPMRSLKIADSANGLWGFSISFMTRNEDGDCAFYFLPDPELAVGST